MSLLPTVQLHTASSGHNEPALWELYFHYGSHVSYWIRRTDSSRILSQDERDDLVYDVFAKFFHTCHTMGNHFETGAAAAVYLRCCAMSMTNDAIRQTLAVQHEYVPPPAPANDPASITIEAEAAQELIGCIQAELQTEQERVIVFCWLHDIPPREICLRYAHLFPARADLYHIQKLVRLRLARCLSARCSELASTRVKNPPSAARPLVTHLSAPLAPRPPTKQGTTRQESRTQQAVAVSILPTMKTVTYHQQVSFCGKARCRKCREGLGHGPYWYAYSYRNGRSVRQYIGKTLPENVMREVVAQP